MKTAHTPTPWHVEDYTEIWNESGSMLIAATSFSGMDGSLVQTNEEKLNAAFIVKSVNCHDELVECLKLARAELHDVDDEFMDKINSTLAKANGDA